MSHSKERAEKVCLNCGAHIHGRYCQVCGQENIEPKETVWGLITHFTYDITHFDGKFFSTVKSLITKPGFLSQEYIKGRRASYLHPIRMYVFTSAFFFIIFFSFFNPASFVSGVKDTEAQLKELTDAREELTQNLTLTRDSVKTTAINRSISHMDVSIAQLQKTVADKKIEDSLELVNASKELDSLGNHIPGLKAVSRRLDSAGRKKTVYKEKGRNTGLSLEDLPYHSLMAYDSVQKELPEDKRDSWLQSGIIRKNIGIAKKANNNKQETLALYVEKFMHTIPQVLFVSLPVFALLLLMLYARRSHYYVDHGIFTIHLYCATFIFLLVYFGINKLETMSGWKWLKYVNVVLMIGIFFYLYKAMRKFYRQGRIKTILKFIILNIASFFVFLILSVILFVLSLIQ